MRDQRHKYRAFNRRVFILGALKLGLLSVLSGRLYYLQIMKSEKYKTLSKNNNIKLSIVPSFRGNILDRNEKLLVDNEGIYSAIINRDYLIKNKHSIEYFNDVLGYQSEMSAIGIEKVLKKNEGSAYVPVHSNLSWKDIAKISSSLELQEFEIIEEARRRYIYGDMLGHLTGYISKPNAKEVQNSQIPNCHEFKIGKNGIEKSFNSKLLGKPGIRVIEINAKRRFMRELSYQVPVTGDNLKTSIDLKLQQIIASKLENINASVVVLNPLNGEIIGMHSSPSYDPNKFVYGLSTKEWSKFVSDPEHPLINKAISATYPPGSIFKLVTALAILSANISPQADVICTGEVKIGNRVFKCWNKHGHGRVNFEQAIARSCNVYFYIYGQRAGIEAISSIAKKLGLGTNTGIELPFENSGIIPDKGWKAKIFSKSWTLGDTINTSIGQGYVLVTPMQLAVLLARVATGKLISPSLIQKDNSDVDNAPSLDIPKSHLELVRAGLFNVFNDPNGTGYKKRIVVPGFEISGKTGTAQVVRLKEGKLIKKQHQDHGIFVGYLSDPKHSFLISTIYEHGGWGSSSALPLAVEIIKEYFGLNFL